MTNEQRLSSTISKFSFLFKWNQYLAIIKFRPIWMRTQSLYLCWDMISWLHSNITNYYETTWLHIGMSWIKWKFGETKINQRLRIRIRLDRRVVPRRLRNAKVGITYKSTVYHPTNSVQITQKMPLYCKCTSIIPPQFLMC